MFAGKDRSLPLVWSPMQGQFGLVTASLVLYLRARLKELTRMEHHIGLHIKGRLLSLSACIRLGGTPVANALAYYGAEFVSP